MIELDRADARRPPIVVSRISESGALEPVVEKPGDAWGRFLRFDYLRLDFSAVEKPGMYVVRFGDVRSDPFRIGPDVFERGVWQPTLEYFLPVQMCHMRVNERYRVWHDVCHLDDARMAPVGYNHFDGYVQGPTTLTRFEPGQPVPGLNRGGWHDAGDDDLRIESQADTVHGLALAYEAFAPSYDNTTIDQAARVVEIHRPDGKPDMLQQIEHGVLTVAGGYGALGRFYRGIITPTLRQYVQVGDFGAQTDNVVFDPKTAPARPPAIGTGVIGAPDDRWVFTEQNAAPRVVGRGRPGGGLSRAARLRRSAGRRVPAHRRGLLEGHARRQPASGSPRQGAARRANRPRRRTPAHDEGPAVRRLPRRAGGGDRPRLQGDGLDRGSGASAHPGPGIQEGRHGCCARLSRRGGATREEDTLRRALRARHLGRRLGDPAVRHAAVFPAHRVSGHLSERVRSARPGLRARMPPGAEHRVVRLGRRRALGHEWATASTAPIGAIFLEAACRAPR